MGPLEIIAIVAAALILGLAVLFLVAWKAPHRVAFLGKVLMRSKRLREATNKQLASEMAENPELIEQVVGQSLGRDQARQVSQVIGNRSAEETEELLETLMNKAQSGERITAQDLARKKPRTHSEARAKAKKKARSRQKRKAAKKQRKRR